MQETLQKIDECDLVAVADVDEKHMAVATTLGPDATTTTPR